jgi:fatty-acyl-CoA synthase
VIGLSSFIRFHAARAPDRVALVYGDARVSYGAFFDRIERTGGWLESQGIGAGDVVAVVMKNSLAFIELAFAVSHIGAVFLPINFRLAASEISYIIENAGVQLLVADAEFAASVAGLPRVVLIDEPTRADSSRLAVAGLRAAVRHRQPDDLYRLMYTSGTTDHPKGVMHTYANAYWKSMDHVLALGLSSKDRLLIAGPLYHVGAFDLPGMAVLWVGGMLVIHRDFEPASVLESIAREQLTGGWLAPVMLSAILTLPSRSAYDVGSLRWVIGGGERTPDERIRAFSAFFTGGRYIDAYGLTETCSGDTLMEAGREIEKIGSVGRSLAHVAIEIRNEEGQALPAGASGEICLRGPKVTQGYWRDPGKTKASFFGDWFRSGDIGHLDTDGFLYLTDRRKDMIISGGENIASSEVERVLYQLPQIREVAVIGVPDAKWGERPVAVVVLNPGHILSYAALARHCRCHLAGFKVPARLIVRDQLPRNPSGKILKRLLRTDIAASLQAGDDPT